MNKLLLDISKKVAETNIDLEREKIKNQMKKQQKLLLIISKIVKKLNNKYKLNY